MVPMKDKFGLDTDPSSHHSADAAFLVSTVKCLCLHITEIHIKTLKEIKECEFRALGIFLTNLQVL